LGATVVLAVQSSLLSLLAGPEGVTRLVRAGAQLRAFDYHCPLPSAPLAFKTDVDTIPAETPYIRSNPVRAYARRERLGTRTRPRIGLVWSGNPRHPNDRSRTVALEQILRLANDSVECISLQKEMRESDASVLASRTDVRQFGGELRDFAETAALVEHMDLVVTVDTSVAHLAGAMGKPTWILLPFNPDWR
jgi:ADP-heptose:LPS heptosyltransferase